jgi:hypothetical protein
MRRLLHRFPRPLALVPAALLALGLAHPALGQDDDEPEATAQEEAQAEEPAAEPEEEPAAAAKKAKKEEEPEEEAAEEEEPGLFRRYLSDRTNVAAAGLNGILTSVADPVARARQPVETFSGWVTPFRQTLSVLTGVLEGGYRAFMGACDLAFAPIPGMPMLSPVQRYKVIGFTHANE